MRVGEQIEALEVMGVNAVGYLFAPRVVAGTLMFPILYVAACIMGIGAAALLVQMEGIATMQVFLQGARNYFEPYDAVYGATKALVFGFLLTSISCYTGFRASGGAEGIGRAATRAAVLSSIYVLLADYLLAEILL
jgi:phospholipid/cholesterol/gamma-HCH transport system permease protein